VAGPSGSGKTILADTFLLAGASAGENGVIAVFEQRPPRLRSPALEKLIHSGSVSVVETGSTCLEVDEIAQLIVLEVERMNATRVVIDSLSGLEMLLSATGRVRFRPSLARLLEAMASLGVTVVMTAEIEDRHSFLPLSPERTAFLADGILLQRYVEVGSRLLRMLVVAKLRGSWHSNELRQYHIDDDGVQLEEALGSYDGLLGGRPNQRSHALSVVTGS
jgi:circadian clock protein KaiC